MGVSWGLSDPGRLSVGTFFIWKTHLLFQVECFMAFRARIGKRAGDGVGLLAGFKSVPVDTGLREPKGTGTGQYIKW